MPVTADKSGPYTSPSAVLDIVRRYRERGLPTPVNGDVLARAGIAESLIPRTLQSLTALDLIDAETGSPTDTFEGLRLAPESEYKQRLADWLRGAYADVFAFVDPAKDDESRIRDAFRSYKPVGQQDRMVSLFTALCAAAGLIPEKSAGAGGSSARPRSPKPHPMPRPQPRPAQSSGLKFVRAARNAAASSSRQPMPSGLPAALAGLLESLPANGWSEDTRAKFLKGFEAVLDFCIPIVEDEPETNENGGQD